MLTTDIISRQKDKYCVTKGTYEIILLTKAERLGELL